MTFVCAPKTRTVASGRPPRRAVRLLMFAWHSALTLGTRPSLCVFAGAATAFAVDGFFVTRPSRLVTHEARARVAVMVGFLRLAHLAALLSLF